MSEEPKLKPGQKFPTPTPGNGDRVFYETLLAQRPSSEMAQEWCLAYGVMEEKDAEKAFKAMVKRKDKDRGRSRSPPPPLKKSTSGKKKKKGKRVLDDVEYDAGMDTGGDEGIGAAAL
mmetsp:Transcript_35615/g.76063  ORF Transcript_35615/g.76063 Transcript_35615/m.76063 type:complete len:118 (+) Transcript_35615:246-599(+)